MSSSDVSSSLPSSKSSSSNDLSMGISSLEKGKLCEDKQDWNGALDAYITGCELLKKEMNNPNGAKKISKEELKKLIEDYLKKAEQVQKKIKPKSSEKEKEALLNLASIYLGLASTGRDGNQVAKFHLGNGAKLHLINWAGDLSRKGLRQSAGLMVNYLYDLGSVEDNHERFANGEIVYSRAVGRLMTP
jgi:hypothetical protein